MCEREKKIGDNAILFTSIRYVAYKTIAIYLGNATAESSTYSSVVWYKCLLSTELWNVNTKFDSSKYAQYWDIKVYVFFFYFVWCNGENHDDMVCGGAFFMVGFLSVIHLEKKCFSVKDYSQLHCHVQTQVHIIMTHIVTGCFAVFDFFR